MSNRHFKSVTIPLMIVLRASELSVRIPITVLKHERKSFTSFTNVKQLMHVVSPHKSGEGRQLSPKIHNPQPHCLPHQTKTFLRHPAQPHPMDIPLLIGSQLLQSGTNHARQSLKRP